MRRRGFTLIELLVVIAIIGILAAMLFPVFARARESARKTQCLANVKNLALAVNMYLSDYDKFGTKAIDSGLNQWLSTFHGDDNGPGGGGDGYNEDTDNYVNCKYFWSGNPYEQSPVVLDDYTKNRDIWRCPSARISWGPAWILGPPAGGGPWWQTLKDHEGEWGVDGRFAMCQVPFPPGWGGEVTDSFLQDSSAAPKGGTAAAGAFQSGYAMPSDVWGLGLSSMQDASSWIVVGEYGIRQVAGDMVQFAYPDICHTKLCQMYQAAIGSPNCCGPSTDCAGTETCSYPDAKKFWTDSSIRKQNTRHLGGANLGFADGHAKWFASEAMLVARKDCKAKSDFNDGSMYTGDPAVCRQCCIDSTGTDPYQ